MTQRDPRLVPYYPVFSPLANATGAPALAHVAAKEFEEVVAKARKDQAADLGEMVAIEVLLAANPGGLAIDDLAKRSAIATTRVSRITGLYKQIGIVEISAGAPRDTKRVVTPLPGFWEATVTERPRPKAVDQ